MFQTVLTSLGCGDADCGCPNSIPHWLNDLDNRERNTRFSYSGLNIFESLQLISRFSEFEHVKKALLKYLQLVLHEEHFPLNDPLARGYPRRDRRHSTR